MAATFSSMDAVSEAARILRAERVSLSGLSGEIEPEFLSLGATLADMGAIIGRVAAATVGLRRVMQSEGGESSFVGSRDLLLTIGGVIRASTQPIDELCTRLSDIASSMSTLAASEGEFVNSVTVFWMLKTAFRVEAAALAPAHRDVLLGLTVRMDEIHNGLQGIIGDQFARLSQTEKSVRSLLNELRELQSFGHETLTAAEGEVGRESAAIARAFAPAAEFSAIVSKQAALGADRVGAVLVSLQYPDIVRQKVEHIAQSIDTMAAQLEQADSDGSNAHVAVRAGAVAHLVTRVQIEQLRDARLEIERAGHSTTDGIRGLISVGEVVMDAARRLQKLATEGTTEVRESAQVAVRLDASLRRIVRDVSSIMDRFGSAVVSEMAALVLDLKENVLEKGGAVRLIALNASSQAIRVPGGRALTQLSALTQTNSEDVLGLTLVMHSQATRILDDVSGLQRAFAECGRTMQGLERALDAAIPAAREKIEVACDSFLAGFSGVESEFNRTRGQAQETLRHSHFTETVIHRFGRAESAFARLLRVTEPLFEQAKGEGGVQDTLDALSAKYTMERERMLHASVAAAARTSLVWKTANLAPKLPDVGANGGAAGPDDNVEWF